MNPKLLAASMRLDKWVVDVVKEIKSDPYTSELEKITLLQDFAALLKSRGEYCIDTINAMNEIVH